MNSHYSLGELFEAGKRGEASNVAIEEHEWGGTMLVGFGHAVYAYRFENGFTIGFFGWFNDENVREHAGSPSTKMQYTKLGVKHSDYLVEGADEGAAPKLDDFHPGDWELLMMEEMGATA